jgi:hypothetical protein
VLGGYDPKLYNLSASTRQHRTGRRFNLDRFKDLKRTELARCCSRVMVPTVASDVNFPSMRLSPLNRGVIFGIAHIRGGGELGKSGMTRADDVEEEHLHRLYLR